MSEPIINNMGNTKSPTFTVVDLFSGVGGLSMGFQKNGFELVFANDNDKSVAETFRANNPDIHFFDGDIRDLTANHIKEVVCNKEIDVLVAGIPCQSFSMAGYRIRKNVDNSDDYRHFLFKEVLKIAKALSPKIILIENVKGLLSSHDGKIKEEIVKDLSEIGYSVDYKVLNAADYGVPQLRERVVFIGNRIGIKNKFPKKTRNEDNYVSVWDAIKDPAGPNHEPRYLEGIVLERIKKIKPGQNWTSLPKNLQTRSRHSGAYGRLDPNKPSKTILTRFDTPTVGYVTHPYENRTLTVREGARIQGFPDDFVFKGPKLSQFRQVGNAVPIGLSYVLAKEIKSMLLEHN